MGTNGRMELASPPTPGPAAGPHRTRSVSIYRHDTREESTATWTLLELLVAIGWYAGADTDWTFVLDGEEPDSLAISTAGPERFIGQHPLWGDGGKLEGTMIFEGLTLPEVYALLEKFYAGRSAESCFAPHYGRFEFCRPDCAGRRQL